MYHYFHLALIAILGIYIARAARQRNTHQVIVGILAFILIAAGQAIR